MTGYEGDCADPAIGERRRESQPVYASKVRYLLKELARCFQTVPPMEGVRLLASFGNGRWEGDGASP